MTAFLIVLPSHRTAELYHCGDMDDALIAAGLSPRHVDHGAVWRNLGIVVSEYGLFEPPAKQDYFSIDRRLYAGPAVLYAHDDHGRTVDYEYAGRWFGRWYANGLEIEAAIMRGEIDRPTIALDGKVTWRWPAPRPKTNLSDQVAAALAEGRSVLIDGDTLIQPTRK